MLSAQRISRRLRLLRARRSGRGLVYMRSTHIYGREMSPSLHPEIHRTQRIGWLRAAVLGANDGIVSTASLIVGVAAAATTKSEILIAGIAGLVAGAMSMAA